MQMTLKFGNPNAKLKALAKRFKMVLKTFSLPSGWTCPAAKECHSRADRETGKIEDGKHTQFRCFQASAEALYPSLRAMVWHNHDLLMAKINDGVTELADLIHASLPKKFDILRVHVGGDYFNLDYLAAWCEVAKRNPEKMFYSYTKSTHLWELAEASNGIPSNLILTASRGGWFDDKIEENAYKCAEVVFSEEEAAQKGLEIDHDDSHAAFGKESFALLLHGTQPKGSEASKALSKLRKAGKGGYTKGVTMV